MPAANLPTLRGTAQQVLYPFTRVVSCMTTVTTFQNSTEQRWVARPPLYQFILPMGSLSQADRASWLVYFSGRKGRFEVNLALTLGGTTYSDLTLMSDNLAFNQSKYDLFYDQQVSLRQAQAANFSSYTPPSVGSLYPPLSYGQVTPEYWPELPFSQSNDFLTSVGDNPFGPRFAYSWFGSGSPFPPGRLRTWRLSYPLLTDADIATLENFFLGKQGRYGTFYFPDPTPVALLLSGIGSGNATLAASDGFNYTTGAYLMVDDEIMLVTGGGGSTGASTLSITRAQLGTSAASHSNAAALSVVYPNVRFAADDLPLKYLTKNQNSTELQLVQIWT